jgi:hypothetical protein
MTGEAKLSNCCDQLTQFTLKISQMADKKIYGLKVGFATLFTWEDCHSQCSAF